jgi:hypothetical protein
MNWHPVIFFLEANSALAVCLRAIFLDYVLCILLEGLCLYL